MKLRKAYIKNFRLLKNLELNFSTSEKQPLTVIRASNETGKTTCLRALTWALYGKNALPKSKGNTFSLAPADMNQQSNVNISVEIEFETDTVMNPGRPNQNIKKKIYKLKRQVTEKIMPDEGNSQLNEFLDLYEVTESGLKSISENHEINEIIENAIPKELKDIYFTDGDAAMSFIEASASKGVKRKRVSDAIERLLGLDSLENAIRHTGDIASRFSKQIDNTDYASALTTNKDMIEALEMELKHEDENVRVAEENIKDSNSGIEKTQASIDEIIRHGNRNELIKKRNDLQERKQSAENSGKESLIRLASILSSRSLANSLISGVGMAGMDILNQMSEKKQLPKANIPVMKELLERSKCFCGASLDESDGEGNKRREHIKHTITASEEADLLSEVATSLYYSLRDEEFGKDSRDVWMKTFSDNVNKLAQSDGESQQCNHDLEQIEDKINGLKDKSLEVYKTKMRAHRETLSSSQIRLGEATQQMRSLEAKIAQAKSKRAQLERKLDRADVNTSKMRTARIAEEVFTSIFNKMKDQEVDAVSAEMNRIFLEMIGASKDPENNELSLISRAELTKDFDIAVYGPNGHKLNPDDDLNGASRRAITLAFILALTSVSQVDAPNVIDTPLGMMAGYVKQSVLLRAIEEGSQVILFLTQDEIKGVERILDKYAGIVFTLTNPAHYPEMLVNKPEVEDLRIIRCECNHNVSCHICERKFIEIQ